MYRTNRFHFLFRKSVVKCSLCCRFRMTHKHKSSKVTDGWKRIFEQFHWFASCLCECQSVHSWKCDMIKWHVYSWGAHEHMDNPRVLCSVLVSNFLKTTPLLCTLSSSDAYPDLRLFHVSTCSQSCQINGTGPLEALRPSVENGWKKSHSDPFRFLLCSVHFHVSEIPFRERGFSVRFCRTPFSSGIDP
jgi:hypothetical protein